MKRIKRVISLIIVVVMVVSSMVSVYGEVPETTDFFKIESSSNHTLAIKGDNTLWVAGSNEKGQLGLGAGIPSVSEFTQVIMPEQVVDIAIAEGFSLVLLISGDVYYFGDRSTGLSGDGNMAGIAYIHTKINEISAGYTESGNSIVKKIDLGVAHAIALTSEGVGFDGVYMWGDNSRGQLGSSSADIFEETAEWYGQVGDSMQDMSAGDYFTVAISEGKIQFAGSNKNNEYSFEEIEFKANWVEKTTTNTFSKVDCGDTFTVLTEEGTGNLYAFGNNAEGRLGVGNLNKSSLVHKIFSGNVTQFSTEGSNTIFKTSSNEIYGFGVNGNAELGTKEKINITSPQKLYFGFKPTSISMGTNSSVIVTTPDDIAISYFSGNNNSNKFGLVDGTKTELDLYTNINGEIVKINPTSITFKETNVEHALNEEFELEYDIQPKIGAETIANNYEIRWELRNGIISTGDGNKLKGTMPYGNSNVIARLFDKEGKNLGIEGNISVNIVEVMPTKLVIDGNSKNIIIDIAIGNTPYIDYTVEGGSVYVKDVEVKTEAGEYLVGKAVQVEKEVVAGEYPKLKLTGIREGTEQLRVYTSEALYDTFQVTVIDSSYVEVEGIEPVGNIELIRGQSIDTVDMGNYYKVMPETASDKRVKFSTKPDEDIFMIDTIGNKLIALKVGKSELQVTTERNPQTIIVDVIVSPNDEDIEELTKVNDVIITSVNLDMKVGGKKEQITAEVLPKTAVNKEVSWDSSNNLVVTVVKKGIDINGYEVAELTAVGEGTAVITVTTLDGGFTDNIFVTVTKDEVEIPPEEDILTISITGNKGIYVGEKLQLTAVVKNQKNETITGKTITWDSSNETSATVSQTGEVEGKVVGTPTIRARLEENLAVESSVKVDIKKKEETKPGEDIKKEDDGKFTYKLDPEYDPYLDWEIKTNKNDKEIKDYGGFFVGETIDIKIKFKGDSKDIKSFKCTSSNDNVISTEVITLTKNNLEDGKNTFKVDDDENNIFCRLTAEDTGKARITLNINGIKELVEYSYTDKNGEKSTGTYLDVIKPYLEAKDMSITTSVDANNDGKIIDTDGKEIIAKLELTIGQSGTAKVKITPSRVDQDVYYTQPNGRIVSMSYSMTQEEGSTFRFTGKSAGTTEILVTSKGSKSLDGKIIVNVKLTEKDVVKLENVNYTRADKDLRIKFTMPLRQSTIIDDYVYVSSDTIGNNRVEGIKVSLIDGKTIQLTKENGWERGKDYYVILMKNIESYSGIKLGRNISYKINMK